MNCGVDHRCGFDPVLLWLWCRLMAAALIPPLAWELPYAVGVALKRPKKKKKLKPYGKTVIIIQKGSWNCSTSISWELVEIQSLRQHSGFAESEYAC